MDETREQETWSSSTVTPANSCTKKEQSQQAEGTRWGRAHFSVCDISLGNHSLRSSLCAFLLSFSAGKQWNRLFFFFRCPFAFHLYWLTRNSKVQRGRERPPLHPVIRRSKKGESFLLEGWIVPLLSCQSKLAGVRLGMPFRPLSCKATERQRGCDKWSATKTTLRLSLEGEQRNPLWFPYPFFIWVLVTNDGEGKKR